MMEMQEILKALETFSRTFPHEAIEEAVSQREEITPELLRILEYTVENAEQLVAEDPECNYFAHMYALFMLAQFRETRAYPLVVKFARLPKDLLELLAGDFISEELDCVLASVCDGDTRPIESLIEDPGAYEFVRSAAIRALSILVAGGDKTRDEVIRYYKHLFEGNLEKTAGAAWTSLVRCAVLLHPAELYDHIAAAYEEDNVEHVFFGVGFVDQVMTVNQQEFLERLPKAAPVYIQDVIEEMENWACFDRPKKPAHKKSPLKRIGADSLFEEVMLECLPAESTRQSQSPKEMPQSAGGWSDKTTHTAKVKPNAPCPCGSGKKYKKCCGRMS